MSRLLYLSTIVAISGCTFHSQIANDGKNVTFSHYNNSYYAQKAYQDAASACKTNGFSRAAVENTTCFGESCTVNFRCE